VPTHSALIRWLLAGGIIAGVMLSVVIGVVGATRGGFSVWRNGVSQLGTGDGAWVFTVAFVLGGVLLGGFALGLRRVLRPGRGATWGPIVIAMAAVGFIIGGLSAAPFILARRLRPDARGLATFSTVTGTLIIGFSVVAGIAYRLDSLGILRPAPAGILEQISLLAAYGWLIAIGIRYRRTPPVGAST
jgi:hypothetical protein